MPPITATAIGALLSEPGQAGDFFKVRPAEYEVQGLAALAAHLW